MRCFIFHMAKMKEKKSSLGIWMVKKLHKQNLAGPCSIGLPSAQHHGAHQPAEEETPSTQRGHRYQGESHSHSNFLKSQYSLPPLWQCNWMLRLCFRRLLEIQTFLKFFLSAVLSWAARSFFKLPAMKDWKGLFKWMPKRHCRRRKISAFSVTPVWYVS